MFRLQLILNVFLKIMIPPVLNQVKQNSTLQEWTHCPMIDLGDYHLFFGTRDRLTGIRQLGDRIPTKLRQVPSSLHGLRQPPDRLARHDPSVTMPYCTQTWQHLRS